MEKIRQPLSSHAKQGFDVAGASEAPFPPPPSPQQGKCPQLRPRGTRPAQETEEAGPASPRKKPSAHPPTHGSPAGAARLPGAPLYTSGFLSGCPTLIARYHSYRPCLHSLIRFRWEHMKQWEESDFYSSGAQLPAVPFQLKGLEAFREWLGEMRRDRALKEAGRWGAVGA